MVLKVGHVSCGPERICVVSLFSEGYSPFSNGVLTAGFFLFLRTSVDRTYTDGGTGDPGVEECVCGSV